MHRIIRTGGLIMLFALAGMARADILSDQPHDFRFLASSFIAIDGTDALAGDDFRITQRTRIDSATFYMITTWPNVPWDWGLFVHRTVDDHPFNDFPFYRLAPKYDPSHHVEGASSITDLGFWPGDPTYRSWEVRFDDLDLILDPADTLEGIFWFSPYGVGQNVPLTRSYAGSSGDGLVNGSRAWFRTIPWEFPGWNGVSQNIDLAFRLEGEVIPAPGVFAPLMLLAVQCRRHRRSTM